MIKIDLNPKKRKKVKGDFSPLKGISLEGLSLSLSNEKVIFLIPVVVIFSTFAWFGWNKYNLSKTEEEIQNLKNEINKLKPLEVKAKKFQSKIAQIEKENELIVHKLKIYEKMYEDKTNNMVIPQIKVAITQIKDGIWLENLKVDQQNTYISGYSLSDDQINDFYRSLALSFQDVNYSNVKTKDKEIKGIIIDESNSNNKAMYYSFKIEARGLKWKN
ncbi:PilN domain-containing protein [Sulfurihydrogenibium azorense]|jgi:hypothetical protein|uniref:PilN domain-containing protein n=1 Tax=Sulfurihydrogenibium azorense TaxID=309806 RepID=UPI00391C5425